MVSVYYLSLLLSEKEHPTRRLDGTQSKEGQRKEKGLNN